MRRLAPRRGNSTWPRMRVFVPVVGCEADAHGGEFFARDIVVDEASIDGGRRWIQRVLRG